MFGAVGVLFVVGAAAAGGASLTRVQLNALLIENVVPSLLTFLTTLFVIASIVYLRQLARGISQLVFYLLCCSFINQFVVFATVFMLQFNEIIEASTCKFLACVLQFTDIAQCFWTFAIACNSFVTNFVTNKFVTNNFNLVANVAVWGMALVLAVVPIHTYEHDSIWCTTSNHIMDFFTLYLWIILVAIAIIAIYASIIVSLFVKNRNLRVWHLLKPRLSPNDIQSYRDVLIIRKMAFYPFLFIVCWFMSSVNGVAALFEYTMVAAAPSPAAVHLELLLRVLHPAPRVLQRDLLRDRRPAHEALAQPLPRVGDVHLVHRRHEGGHRRRAHLSLCRLLWFDARSQKRNAAHS